MSPFYVSVRYVNLLLDVAEHRGAPRDALCRLAGVDLPQTQTPDGRVSADRYYDLWAAAMDRLADPALPIRVAKRMSATRFDMLRFAMLTSGDLSKALRIIQRYQPFVTNIVEWEIEEANDRTFVGPRFLGPPRAERRYAAEFGLAHIVLMARAFTGTDVVPCEACYAHSEPPDTAPQDALFRAPLRFECPSSGLRLSRASLELPFLKADDELATHFESHLGKVVAAAAPNLVSQVRRQIAENLPQQAASIERVSRQLGHSPRSLRRHLQEQGVSFVQLLHEVRASAAKRHLRDGALPLGEIAFMLGYSETSAFHRAFRRWTGITPDEYRGRRGGAHD